MVVSLGTFRFRLVLVLSFILLPFSERKAVAQEERSTLEYQIKASLIFNFLEYVEWPPEIEELGDGLLRLCIFGNEPFGRAFKAFEGEVVRGLRVEVRRSFFFSSPESEGCDVVFLGNSIKNEVEGALGSLKGRPVLTIGESPNFLTQGGSILFLIEARKVKFDINHEGIKEARLTVSSKLLRLAHNSPLAQPVNDQR